jgi:hypothetical protein
VGPPYGTQSGRWANLPHFVATWAEDGRTWVNLGLRIDDDGEPYIEYEVPFRGERLDPLPPPLSPDLNFNEPPFQDGHLP